MEMSSFVILTVLNSELSACASILNPSRGIAGVMLVSQSSLNVTSTDAHCSNTR